MNIRKMAIEEPYVLAIMQGQLAAAKRLAESMDLSDYNHVPLLNYVLTEAAYDNGVKKNIFLFISQLDPISVLNFARQLDFPQFEKFIHLGIDVNVQYKNCTFLHMMLGTKDFLPRVKLLISKGANINSSERVRHFGTLLHMLLANESFAKFIHILNFMQTHQQKVNFHLRDGEGKTLLLLAAKVMAYTPVKRILEEDPTCLEIPDNEGRTPLHIACALGQTAIVELLVRAGANINARDKAGNTPAFYAATNIGTVKTILSSIAIDPERDMFAETNAICLDQNLAFPLSSADAKALNLKITSAPAEHCKGTDTVNILSCLENKNTFEKNQYFGIELVCIEYIQQCMRSFCGKTIAEDCLSGHLAVMNMLIRYGADVSLQNDAGITPEEFATDTDIAACVQKAAPEARFHRLQTWCLNFANSGRSIKKPDAVQAMQGDEPTDDWRFYRVAGLPL